MDDRQEALNICIWWMPAAFLLVLQLSPGGVSPDGVELAMAGTCLWQMPFEASACVGLEPWHWPPVFPLLAGLPTLAGLDPGLAAPWVSSMSMAVLCLPVAIVAGWVGSARRTRNRRPEAQDGPARGAAWGGASGLCAVLLLLALPAARVHAGTGDARSLFLLLLFCGVGLTLGPPEPRRRAALGLVLGVASLTRPEGLLYAAAILGLTTVRWRRLSGTAWAVFGAVVVPYWGVLSGVAGRPVMSSRGWQSAAYGWLRVFPEESVKNELAAGSWGTPLRRVLSTSEVAASVPATLDPGSASTWLAYVWVESVPFWLAVFAVVGLGVSIRHRRWVGLATLAAVGLPALAVQLVPQAQDVLLPANNLLPFLVVLVVLGGVGVVALGTAFTPRAPRVGMGLLAATALAVGLLNQDLEPPPESPAVALAAAWIQTELPSSSEVAASLVSAPIVLRARRLRRAVPAPWSQGRWRTSPPDYLVVSSADLPALSPLLRDLTDRDQLELQAVVGTDEWVRIYRLRKGDGG